MNTHDSSRSLVPHMLDAAPPHTGTSFAEAPSRYRGRDVGVGYGRSSGYALDKRYTRDWGGLRFRFR